MEDHRINRRRLLRGIAATGVSFGAIGTASAQEEQRYVATGGNRGQLGDAGFTVERELAGGSVFVVSGPEDAEDDLGSVRGINAVTRDFAVELSDPVAETHTTEDAAFSELQWDKRVTDAFEAHDYATGDGTRIAIIDTGIDPTHPDLQNVITDLSRAFIDGDASEGADYTGDHGTHVAGIAAGTGAVGITGIALDAELVSLRVFGEEGGAAFADILAAADYAAEIGADSANMSIGTQPIPPQANSEGQRVAVQKVMQDVSRRGTVLTVSAGNAMRTCNTAVASPSPAASRA